MVEKGVIIKGIGGFYYIRTESGKLIESKAKGIFRKWKITPLVGDTVDISYDGEGENGSVSKIYDRSNELVRPAVANVTQLVLVCAAASPAPSFSVIDKMLVAAEIRQIPALVCINKCDLDDAEKIYEVYRLAGYPALITNALTGEGVSELLEYLKDHITVFAGSSGVGKSSLLNAISSDFALETGHVSRKIERGRHTTRHSELMVLDNGGFVIDTPGFGSFETERMKKEELQYYFREFVPFLEQCRFRGCYHYNEPDCAVRQAVQAGKIPQSRYDSYREMFETVKNIKEWEL